MLHHLVTSVVGVAWIFAVLWGAERLWATERPSAASYRRGLIFTAAMLFANGVFNAAFAALPFKPTPLIDLHALGWSAFILAPLVTFFVYDFFQYWMHRAQHRWFWKQHAIHHSIEELSGINAYSHWTERLFRIGFATIPMTFLFGREAASGFLLIVWAMEIHGNYLHSPIPLNFGRFRLVLADNVYHRIHHSTEREHFDRNFATRFPLWDWLFGTLHVPQRGEWPKAGLADHPEPRTIADYALRPFLRDSVKLHLAVGDVFAARQGYGDRGRDRSGATPMDCGRFHRE